MENVKHLVIHQLLDVLAKAAIVLPGSNMKHQEGKGTEGLRPLRCSYHSYQIDKIEVLYNTTCQEKETEAYKLGGIK